MNGGSFEELCCPLNMKQIIFDLEVLYYQYPDMSNEYEWSSNESKNRNISLSKMNKTVCKEQGTIVNEILFL